ncbi:unnamed protein product [Ectocarpus sp. CCAP 1310/34]|nr:unnamed protein product [Ectocarpus sp. CCAP 1310/34]
MRQGLGSHRNPTATQAKERAARGDLNRGLHGGSRANHNRTSRKGNDFIASGVRGQIILPVTDEERSATMRAPSRNPASAVMFPRYLSIVKPRADPTVEGSASQESTPASAGQTPEVFNPHAPREI